MMLSSGRRSDGSSTAKSQQNISSTWNETIIELTVEEGGTISEDNDILEEILRFNEHLYTTEMDIDLNDSFANFTEDLSTNLQKVTENERDTLEGKLTLVECRRALKCLGSGKSPGEYGFTLEFYKFFFELLSQEFLDCVNAAMKIMN